MAYRRERVAERILKLGLDSHELAQSLEMSYQQFRRYISDKSTTNPTIETLVKLANELKCTTDYLLGLSDDSEPSKLQEPVDPLSSLGDDEIAVLLSYRERRIALQNEVINESIAELNDTLRESVRTVIANALKAQGKFDSRRNNP